MKVESLHMGTLKKTYDSVRQFSSIPGKGTKLIKISALSEKLLGSSCEILNIYRCPPESYFVEIEKTKRMGDRKDWWKEKQE